MFIYPLDIATYILSNSRKVSAIFQKINFPFTLHDHHPFQIPRTILMISLYSQAYQDHFHWAHALFFQDGLLHVYSFAITILF